MLKANSLVNLHTLVQLVLGGGMSCLLMNHSTPEVSKICRQTGGSVNPRAKHAMLKNLVHALLYCVITHVLGALQRVYPPDFPRHSPCAGPLTARSPRGRTATSPGMLPAATPRTQRNWGTRSKLLSSNRGMIHSACTKQQQHAASLVRWRERPQECSSCPG